MVSGGMDAPGNDQVCRRLRSFGVQFSGDVSLLRSLCFRCISLFCCFVSFSFFSDVVLVERGLIDVGYVGSPSLRLHARSDLFTTLFSMYFVVPLQGRPFPLRQWSIPLYFRKFRKLHFSMWLFPKNKSFHPPKFLVKFLNLTSNVTFPPFFFPKKGTQSFM